MTVEITEDQKLWSQLGLGGASMLIAFPPGDGLSGKAKLAACVMHLMGETEHGHHFAVVGEGYSLACSYMAIECLQNAGLIPKDGEVPAAAAPGGE